MTCARCSWQWPWIPNVVARSYATQLFKAFQWWSWAGPPIHETPAQGRSIWSSSRAAKDPEDSSITNNKWAGGWNHLQLQNTIKTWRPISAQTGITIIQTCHAQFWWASRNSIPNVLSCIDRMASQQLGTITIVFKHDLRTWEKPAPFQ